MTGEIAYLVKRRVQEGVVHENIYGNVGPQAVIVDDILDTGGTLVSCCEQLQQLRRARYHYPRDAWAFYRHPLAETLGYWGQTDLLH